MKNVVIAVLVSVAFHALLAATAALGLSTGHLPDVSVSLDLSQIELSFAEQEDDAAAASAPGAPAAPSREAVPDPAPPERNAPADSAAWPEAPAAPDDPALPPVPEPPLQMETQAPPGQEPSPVAPRQAEVDAPPRPRADIRPDYPRAARSRGEQGGVVLEISVNAEGGVDGVAVVSSSGFAELDGAAERAVRRARFVPASSGGRPVASRARLKLEFKLK